MATQATEINMRELYRNLKSITERVERGESFIVLKNKKPTLRIEPDGKKGFDVGALKKISFNSGEKHLSERIDEIVYGKV